MARLRDKERQVFKTIEVGAGYRIRGEGKSVFGKVLERHWNSYTFQYADEKGKVRTGKVSRSAICGRLGAHLIPDLESAITPAKRRRTAEPKAKTRNAIVPGDVSTAGRLGKSTQERLGPEPAKKMPRPRNTSTARKRGKPSKGQRLLFSD